MAAPFIQKHPLFISADCCQRIRLQNGFMLKKKNVLFIFIIVAAIFLIFTVIIVFNRRIHKIEAKQEKGLKTA